MKVPGEAWLEFYIKNGELYQEATFRPLGLSEDCIGIQFYHSTV